MKDKTIRSLVQGLIVSLLLTLLCLPMAQAEGEAAVRPAAKEQWSILLDKSATLSFDDIRTQSARFQPLDKRAITFPQAQLLCLPCRQYGGGGRVTVSVLGV